MLERRSGISLWKQIATQLRADIAAGRFGESGKLPTEFELAQFMGANRHTVRRAIAALNEEGWLEPRRGEGTFVKPDMLDYPLSQRTRFHEIATNQSRTAHGELLDSNIEEADPTVAGKLDCPVQEPVIRIETLYRSQDTPISTSVAWFVQARVPKLVQDFKRLGSLTKALALAGLGDYRRDRTYVTARAAIAVEIDRLKIADAPVVLVNEYVNLDDKGKPLQFARTSFAASRVRLIAGT